MHVAYISQKYHIKPEFRNVLLSQLATSSILKVVETVNRIPKNVSPINDFEIVLTRHYILKHTLKTRATNQRLLNVQVCCANTVYIKILS